MMNKLISLLLTLLFSFIYAINIQAQDTINLNSRIELDEVTLNIKTNRKLDKIKTKGSTGGTFSSTINTILVSPFSFKKCSTVDYITINVSEESVRGNEEIELYFYDTNAFGLPNKKINEKTLIFNTEAQNSITVSLSELEFPMCNTVFIGLKKTNKGGVELKRNEGFKFKIRRKKNNAIYFKTDGVEEWRIIEDSSLDLTVYYH